MKKYSQPWDYFPLIPVFAFTSVKKARKFVRNKTGLRFEPSGKQGSFTWYDRTGAEGFAVILLKCHDSGTTQKYACLAHECTHYAQAYAQSLDAELDEETQAYVMQSAMLACVDQIGEEWFTTPLQPKHKSEKKTD